MGSSGKYGGTRIQVKPRPWKIHPIWRGIGCLMLIVIPVLALAGAQLMIDTGILGSMLASFGTPMPVELMNELVYLPVASGYSITPLVLILAALLTLIGFAVLMVFYTIIYSTMGPARYGPLDAPPERYVRKKPHIKRS